MQRQYVVLAMMLLFNKDVVSSHVLSTTSDVPLSACMRLLAFAVNDLCDMFGESTEETYEAPFSSTRESETRRMEIRLHIVKRCCTKPCTLIELMSIC